MSPPLTKMPTIPPLTRSRRGVIISDTPVPLHPKDYQDSISDSDGSMELASAMPTVLLHSAEPSTFGRGQQSACSGQPDLRLTPRMSLWLSPTPRNSSPESTTIAGPDGRSR